MNGPNSTGSYKSNQVTITNNLNARDNGGNDACATLRAEKDGFNLYNCNVVVRFLGFVFHKSES